jgi:uncharacterized membrane protein YfcA
MSLVTECILVVAFFAAGFIDSVAGGGGLITVPSLLLAGLPPQAALATNKLASTSGTTVALMNFSRSGMVVWRIAAVGIVFSLIGSAVGTRAVLAFSPEAAAKAIVMLLPLGIAATLFPKGSGRARTDVTRLDLAVTVPLVTFAIGFYDGFFGPGTGSFLILAFHLLLGMELTRASATAKVFNLASNAASLAVFMAGGQVLYLLGLPLAAANIAGNYLGSSLAIRKGSGVVRACLTLSLTLLLATLAWKYLV